MSIYEIKAILSTKGNYLSASCLFLICTLVLSIVLPPVVHAAPGDIVTIAGGGTGVLGDGGLATSATLSYPTCVSSVDAFGNIYIADTYNHRIRKIASGTITTVAGNGTPAYSGDAGPATLASLDHPTGVSIDTLGNIYIADTGNHRIRKVDYSSGTITTVAGTGTGTYSGDYGPATSASLYYPYGVSVDASGNIYIADKYNHRIRKITSGTITTVAGNGTSAFSGDDGPATSASLNYPEAVFVDASGNIYIADTFNHRIRKVNHSSGTITTLAGNGTVIYFGGDEDKPATSASLEYPSGVSADALGNIYIADYTHNRIRRVDASGTISTLAGNGTSTYSGDNGPAISAGLNNPSGVSADALENIYIADYHNHRIRKVSPSPNIKVTDSIPPGNDHKLLFGTVTQGNTSDQTVTVTNSGTIGLVIGTISPPASLFSIPILTDKCSNQPIAPSGSCTLIVRFTPTSPGTVSDSFDIPSNDPNAPTVTLITSGTGTAL